MITSDVLSYEESAGGSDEDVAAGLLLASGIAVCWWVWSAYPYSWGMDAMTDMVAGI